MSFDVDLRIDYCEHCNRSGELVCDLNITHNVNDIVERCLVGRILCAGTILVARHRKSEKRQSCYVSYSWGRLDGWTAAEALPYLEGAVLMSHDPAWERDFRALEPGNKWGSLEGVRAAFVKLRDACARYPEGRIRADG